MKEPPTFVGGIPTFHHLTDDWSVAGPVQKMTGIGFDVPGGGSFRVIDVIVTEAPRFDPAK